MLSLYLQKLREWIIAKEEEQAKKCAIPPKEVEEQIFKLLLEIKKLKEECEDNQKEFGHLLDKLHWIKAKAIECQNELEREIKELKK